MIIQVVLTNDLECEIYRSEPKKIASDADITEVLIHALRVDCIELSLGDTIKIQEIT